MSRVALTGATGFVGASTLATLLEQGHTVKALVRGQGRVPDHLQLEVVDGSLHDQKALAHLVNGCEAVIHIAGAIAGRRYSDFEAVNVLGTANLLAAVTEHAPQTRLIHVSSLAAREPQLSDYAASKAAAERLVVDSALDWQIVRPPAIYGPSDPALAPLWRLLAKGWLPQLASDEARFSLLHVNDLSRLLIASALVAGNQQRYWEPDDGRPGGYRWSDVADIAGRCRGKRIRRVRIPFVMLWGAGALSTAMSRLLPGPAPVFGLGKARELAHIDWVCDNTGVPFPGEWTPNLQLQDSLGDLPGWRSGDLE